MIHPRTSLKEMEAYKPSKAVIKEHKGAEFIHLRAHTVLSKTRCWHPGSPCTI